MMTQFRSSQWACLLLLFAFGNLQQLQAAGFAVGASATSSNVQLKAAVTLPGRLEWLQGDSPNAITNSAYIESVPATNRTLIFNPDVPARFFRAVMFDTNVEALPLAVGSSHGVAITTNGVMQSWGDNRKGQFGNGALMSSPVYYTTGCWYVTIGYTNDSQGPLP